MHFLRLLRRCRFARSDRPDRLVAYGTFCQSIDVDAVQNRCKLTLYDSKLVPGVTLSQRFANAYDRTQPASQSRGCLGGNQIVRFTLHDAALGMPDNAPLTPDFRDHF